MSVPLCPPGHPQLSILLLNSSNIPKRFPIVPFNLARRCSNFSVKATSSSGGGDEKQRQGRSFLSLEEAGLVEISGLSTHERFLCRLTISSLNLLRVIAEQEGCAIEELNAGRICDWFLKDKLKREQDLGSAVLQWDDSGFGL